VYGTGLVPNTNYYDGVGTRLINEARLLIGGQEISSLSGSYIDLMNDIDVPYENQVGLTQLVGNNDLLTVAFPRTVYTKLNFGIKLPICALARHDVTIEIEFNPVLSSQLTTSNALVASTLVKYSFVSDLERNWFTKHKHTFIYEYLFTRTGQVTKGENVIDLVGYVRNYVKELYLFFQPTNTSYTYLNYLTSLTLLFNGQEYIKRDSTLFRVVSPFETKTTMPSRIMYMLQFNKPINFSRMSDIKLVITSLDTSQLVIHAKTLNTFASQDGMGSFLFT
jgi:hypothetical protein